MKLGLIPFGPIMPPPDLMLALRNPQYFLVARGILLAFIAVWLLFIPRNREDCVARLGGLEWNLRDHECVLVHCERGFRRVTLPPLEADDTVAKWFSRWKRIVF